MFDGKGRKLIDGLEIVAVELVLVDEQVELLQVRIDFLCSSGRSSLTNGFYIGGVHGNQLEELSVLGRGSHQIHSTRYSIPDLLYYFIGRPPQLNNLLLKHQIPNNDKYNQSKYYTQKNTS